MIKLKKIIAALTSLTIIAASVLAVSSLSVSAAGETLSLNVSYDANTEAGSNIYVTASLTGFDESLYVSALDLNIECNETNVLKYLNYANATAVTSGFVNDGGSLTTKVKNTTKNKFLQLSFANINNDPVMMKNGDVVKWTIPIAVDIDEEFALTLNDFTLILMEDLEDSDTEQSFGSTTTTLDLGSVVPQTPAPSETIPTATTATPVFDGTTWPATAATATAIGGTYTGVMEGDTAVAYGVGLKGDNVTTYSKVMWKVTAKGESKGHEMTLNTPIGGEGTAKVGLAIQGLTAEDVEAVSAAFVN